MGPEEMLSFFEEGKENDSTAYAQASTTDQRTNSLFRTRAVSHDLEERPDFNATSKNTVTAPKSFRKISRPIDSRNTKYPAEKPADMI